MALYPGTFKFDLLRRSISVHMGTSLLTALLLLLHIGIV